MPLLLPDIGSHASILNHLNALGWATSNGMGVCKITYSEVLAYCKLMGLSLEPFQVSAIMAGSAAYVAKYYED